VKVAIPEKACSFLDVYTVPLERRWAQLGSVVGLPQLLLQVRRPPDCPGLMYKVCLHNNFVATSITRDGVPFGVLVVAISLGQRITLELPISAACPTSHYPNVNLT
jgi:hypothetical protein